MYRHLKERVDNDDICVVGAGTRLKRHLALESIVTLPTDVRYRWMRSHRLKNAGVAHESAAVGPATSRVRGATRPRSIRWLLADTALAICKRLLPILGRLNDARRDGSEPSAMVRVAMHQDANA
jgi:hypothetical protein